MAASLPNPIKSYQFLVNQYKVSTSTWYTDVRYSLYAFVQMLLGNLPQIGLVGSQTPFNASGMVLPSGQGAWLPHWICAGSSDTAGYDAVTTSSSFSCRWVDYTKLVSGNFQINSGVPPTSGYQNYQAGRNGSWVVLRNTALQMDILYAASNDYWEPNLGMYDGGVLSVAYWGENPSTNKFTGGTLSSRPTSPIETNWFGQNTRWPYYNPNSSFGFANHYIESTDGTSCRFIITVNNFVTAFFLFDRQINAPTEIATYPTIAGVMSNGPNSQSWPVTYSFMDYARIYSNYDWLQFRYNNVSYAACTTGESCRQTGAPFNAGFSIPHDLDSYGYQFFPVGVWGSSSGIRGRLGNLQDLYWGPTGRPDGTTYPSDATCKWAQFGSLIMPWTGQNVSPGQIPYLNA